VELVTDGGGWRTAHEFVRETLRGAILRGDLSGGARLIQTDLASRLEVSTTPVREALRDLATEGLITFDRHRGGTVRALNWAEMEEIRLIREQLDPLAVELAVRRITDATLSQAEDLCGQMAKEIALEDWVDLNRRFHVLFHESTGVPRLAAILKSMEESAAVYVAQAQRARPEIRARANAAHRAYVDACRAREVELARVAMAGHAGMPMEMTDQGVDLEGVATMRTGDAKER
jgi:DNA-binding GntR family transcriptional regulator